jgi:hypothetical protein
MYLKKKKTSKVLSNFTCHFKVAGKNREILQSFLFHQFINSFSFGTLKFSTFRESDSGHFVF